MDKVQLRTWLEMKFIPGLSLTILLLTGCNSLPAPASAPIPVATSFTATKPFKAGTPSVVDPVSSPTQMQLPFNPGAGSDEFCKPPFAFLRVEEGDDISEDEIVSELAKIWLRRYKQPDAPSVCRIADYAIEKIYDDPSVYSQALEPRGDFKRVVTFSIKLTQFPSDWMSFPGELDQDNWLHTSHIVAITKTPEGYTLEFAYP